MTTIKPDLRILLIEVTQKCNAACLQCGSRCDIHSEELLRAEDILKAIQDIKDNIGTDVMINITGGEPLMRKDLFEIMQKIHAMGFDWGMVSNGTLITDSVIEKMKASGMKTITISIDGTRETHEDLRKLPGSYDRILENLRKLKKAHFLDHLQVTFTSNKRNFTEFPALYEELNRIGIDSIRTSFMDPIGRATEHPELMLSRKDMEYLFDFVKEKNKGKGIPIEWGCCHYTGDRLPGRDFLCFAGIYSASILYNGDIFVCPNVERRPELIQGNIRTDSFSRVWKEGFEWFRNRPLPDKCKACAYKEECKGDSVHTFDFDKKQPLFCYKDTFDIREKRYLRFLKKKYGDFKVTRINAPEEAANIYMEPDAYADLRNYFHMGRKHPLSMYEQQIGLVGFKIDNSYVIKYVFPSVTKVLSSDASIFTHETLLHAIKQTKIIRANHKQSDYADDYIGKGLRFLGFAHSHPIQEELIYSLGDEMIHGQLVKKYGDYIGILVNPSLDLIGAYYGEDIRQGNLILIEENEENPKAPL